VKILRPGGASPSEVLLGPIVVPPIRRRRCRTHPIRLVRIREAGVARPSPLAPRMRWFLAETARAFHRARKRTGHFWERRYRACLVEDDTYGLAALRYVDRNPVRAGLVADGRAVDVTAETGLWAGCRALCC